MEMQKNVVQDHNHYIRLDNREKLDIIGVNKVYTFNENLVVLQTKMGMLNVKGKNMKVNKLNVDNGDMSIEGEFVSLVYENKNSGTETKKSIIEKIFK